MQTVSGYSISELVQEAQTRWLKPAEVLFILQNHENHQLTQECPQKPTGGSMFLFNKRVLRFFRRDGHSWRKKRDGRTVGEAHERLKVGNAEALNCYYAHGEQNPNFQRRSYWILDPAYEHIVLVHYREITEGRHNSGTSSHFSPGPSSAFSQGPDSYAVQNPGSVSMLDSYQSYSSPSSVEVSSGVVIKNNGADTVDPINGTSEFSSSPEGEVTHALRRLKEQLSLNDDSFDDIGFYSENDTSNGFGVSEYDREVVKQDDYLQGQEVDRRDSNGYTGTQDGSNHFILQCNTGYTGLQNDQSLGNEYPAGGQGSLYWKEMLQLQEGSSAAESQGRLQNTFVTNQENPSSFLRNGQSEEQRKCGISLGRNNAENSSMLLHQGSENLEFPAYSPLLNTHGTAINYCTTVCGDFITDLPFEETSTITIAQKQKFTIREISPDWGYCSKTTKVIIVGSFLCDPSEFSWNCLIGDAEVPLQIMQEGVLLCQAPAHLPGKVSLCITSGNRESCSEVREFEYCSEPAKCDHCNLPPVVVSKSPEELLLLVRFVQMLLSEPQRAKGDSVKSKDHLLRKLIADEDSWSHVIEGLLVGSGTSSCTVDWILQELLKDKFDQWLSFRCGSSLSKKEQGIIHMVAGLGFEWALSPLLSYGVNINFRDINGWTALHWAARFGREKMVAALIASGASAGAVTDPSSQDPTGKTPASIASTNWHMGLAGYLSEVALTSHLSSLTLEESELSKGSAHVEAEITVNSVSKGTLTASEDQRSLKDTLAAVRNAALAAARIQSAFRAHSFRNRQLRQAAIDAAIVDEYGITPNEIQGISAASKLAFRNGRDFNTAALSIQKKYRGYKGRKDFLDLRQKVVKIQAHVRGHQVRKNYKVFCWAVGILEKVVLRWRRRGNGLRGFHQGTEVMDDSEDEDILREFRKEKVEVAIDEAVSRVLTMVDSPWARQQYHRVLERFRQAKAELRRVAQEANSSSRDAIMESDVLQFP